MDDASSTGIGDGGGFAALVARAQQGDVVALGLLLEAFRPYLLVTANDELPKVLQCKCGGSDLVQETLLEAHRSFPDFLGREPDELRAWLRGILRHNLADCARRFITADCRSINREVSLASTLSSGRLSSRLVDSDPTPATVAVGREEAAALDLALESLTPDERAVILLRNRDHLAWEIVGARLGRSADAARMQWKRAILHLQRFLELER